MAKVPRYSETERAIVKAIVHLNFNEPDQGSGCASGHTQRFQLRRKKRRSPMATVQQPLGSEIPPSDVHHIALKPSALEETALARYGPPFVLRSNRLTQEAAKAASALRDVIERKPAKVVINVAKTFLQFEDFGKPWAASMGSNAAVKIAPNELSSNRAGSAATSATPKRSAPMGPGHLRRWRRTMSRTTGRRSKRVSGKTRSAVSSCASMAQTRAQRSQMGTARQLRLLAWVVDDGRISRHSETLHAEEVDGAWRPRQLHRAARRVHAPSKPEFPMTASGKLCFEIANSPTSLDQLRSRYIPAGNEAKKANDRAALDAFIQAKDARKAELQ